MKNYVRRRKYIIDRKLQFGLALRLFLCLLFVAFVSGSAVYYAVWKTLLVEFHGVHLSRINHAIGRQLVVYGVVAMVALSLLSVFFSHKIAGPIYKMRRIIDRSVNEGTPPEKISLRRGDAFQELAASLNRFFKGAA